MFAIHVLFETLPSSYIHEYVGYLYARYADIHCIQYSITDVIQRNYI